MECNQRRWTKGVNTFERVQNSELSEKITKIKLRKSQKIKLHVTSFEFISFWVIVVSFFLFICHKSHTTMGIDISGNNHVSNVATRKAGFQSEKFK